VGVASLGYFGLIIFGKDYLSHICAHILEQLCEDIKTFGSHTFTSIYFANLRRHSSRVSREHARKSNVWKSQVELHNSL
jgi:hypothetical protein